MDYTSENKNSFYRKRIALIAHDNKKALMIKWCIDNEAQLSLHELCGTGTTSHLIEQETGLSVFGYKSGPLGGDLQIGAEIASGNIDMLIFLSDPLTSQPHDPDVKALSRIAQVYDIPMASNRATADFLIKSIYMDIFYEGQEQELISDENRTLKLEK